MIDYLVFSLFSSASGDLMAWDGFSFQMKENKREDVKGEERMACSTGMQEIKGE